MSERSYRIGGGIVFVLGYVMIAAVAFMFGRGPRHDLGPALSLPLVLLRSQLFFIPLIFFAIMGGLGQWAGSLMYRHSRLVLLPLALYIGGLLVMFFTD